MGNQAEIAEQKRRPAGNTTMILDYVKISKPSIIFLLDFVAISALLVSYYSNVATSLFPPPDTHRKRPARWHLGLGWCSSD